MELSPVPDLEAVAATLCADRHPNDPGVTRCRVCDAAISPAAEVVEVPPSPLGRLLFEDGTAIDLTAGLAIGRSPVDDGGSVDTLTVTGPQVSRRHLVLETRGWQIFVRDCHSTNGTFLSRPGEQGRRRVPTDDAVPVEIGDSIHFGSRQALVVAARPS